MTIPRILIIAGSDSGGGAGIQADIKTVTMLGGHAMTAITAITAQNTLGVDAVMAVPPDMVLAQMDSVIRDIGVDAVKIGMIGSAKTAHAVADRLERLDVPIVFDPVMIATSGSVLADAETIAAFERLMALASVVTPNLPELEALAGIRIHSEADQEDASNAVMERTGCRAILAKGGHWPTTWIEAPPGEILDALYIRNEQGHWSASNWTSPRIDTRHTHGTGCTLASGIAVELGKGVSLPGAIARAREFVRAAMLAAPGFGAGHGPMGHHLAVVPFDEIEG
jgi:hydroxymethylpyrimidine/phosphomethylpyrimidine kinase